MKEYSRRGWKRKLDRLEGACKAATEPSLYQLLILSALQKRGVPYGGGRRYTPQLLSMYAGTAPAAAVTRRRAKNKTARVSRRHNRGK